MVEKIDAHHHLWKYDVVDYGWIDGSMGVLKRDFLPADLERELCRAGIDGTVVVQARQTLSETAWLLNLTDQSSFIRGVVGWASIASENFPADLEHLRSCRKLKGLRHVIEMNLMTTLFYARVSTAALPSSRTPAWFTTS